MLSNHSTIHMTIRPVVDRTSLAAEPGDAPYDAGSLGLPLPEGWDPAGAPQLMENILQTFHMCVHARPERTQHHTCLC